MKMFENGPTDKAGPKVSNGFDSVMRIVPRMICCSKTTVNPFHALVLNSAQFICYNSKQAVQHEAM
jgi:hypothetical protein